MRTEPHHDIKATAIRDADGHGGRPCKHHPLKHISPSPVCGRDKGGASGVALIMEGGAGPQNSFGCMMFPS